LDSAWRKVGKNGDEIPEGAELVVPDTTEAKYISRGGLKLEGALRSTGLQVAGWRCLDVGQSTGGFTDCLLQQGAAQVVGVDVGHGQLAWKLRQDARVVVHEKTNARHLDRARIPEPVDIVVCDASFIGLETVLPAALALARPGARLPRRPRAVARPRWRLRLRRRDPRRPADVPPGSQRGSGPRDRSPRR
jgi:23S rRNA (cytidine1920-2'-O)/16S rRNA (cytidine1409-2'-O)-methyltransferase